MEIRHVTYLTILTPCMNYMVCVKKSIRLSDGLTGWPLVHDDPCVAFTLHQPSYLKVLKALF